MSDMTMPELIVSLHKRIIKDGRRIAELEAVGTSESARLSKLLVETRAELATLKARRCETCDKRGAVVEGTCSCNWDARWNVLSYSCNRWAERMTP